MKVTCPHCGAWDQKLKFCQDCGKTLVFTEMDQARKDFAESPKAVSRKNKEIPLIIVLSIFLTFILFSLLGFLLV